MTRGSFPVGPLESNMFWVFNLFPPPYESWLLGFLEGERVERCRFWFPLGLKSGVLSFSPADTLRFYCDVAPRRLFVVADSSMTEESVFCFFFSQLTPSLP